MVKVKIKGVNDYEIPCISNVSEDDTKVVIISHGLNSSKESPTVKILMERLAAEGIGSFAYDFPAHGDSPVQGEMFRIKNCLDDLEAVESHVVGIAKDAEIMYFSSSFGAYINIIYLVERPHKGSKSFLRAAAVDMPGIFEDGKTPELIKQLEEDGGFILDEDAIRPLKITKEFCMDLENYDIFKLYEAGTASIVMVHGDEDESASYEDAEEFAKMAGALFFRVKGGEHRLMGPGHVSLVMDTAAAFFNDEK